MRCKEDTLRKHFLGGHLFRRLGAFQAVLVFLSLLVLPATAIAADPAPIKGGFGDPAFENIWFRSDLPVITGVTSRSLLWGGEVIRKWEEPYKESKGGSRVVVYFDKARMEITNPDADRNDRFYVTNGLLVRELISGNVQL